MESERSVNDYYDQCHVDYRVVWKLDETLSMHYGIYDDMHRDHYSAVINTNRVLSNIGGLNSSDKVLDVGCGIGGSAIWIAENVGAEVIGINKNEGQIQIANEIIRKRNLGSRVKVINMDFMKTKFQTESFDVVYGIESVCHAEDKKRFLSEAKRIMRNGGRLIVADGFLTNNEVSMREKEEMDKWLRGWAVPNLSRIEDFLRYLRELKYKNIRFIDVTDKVMPSSRRMYFASFAGYPVSRLLEIFGARTKVQTGNVISAYYQHKTLKKGLWKYGIVYAEK